MAREATTVHRNGKTCSMARNERRRLLHTGMARHAELQGMRGGDYCTPEWQDMQHGKEREEETTAHRNGKACRMARNERRRLLHTGMVRHAEWQGMRGGDYCTPEW